MILDKVIFFKDGHSYADLENCLDLEVRCYRRIPISEWVKKVVLPNASLEVFAAELESHETDFDMENVRKQLSLLTLQVEYRDIYENKFTLERSLDWFSRHTTVEQSVSDSKFIE